MNGRTLRMALPLLAAGMLALSACAAQSGAGNPPAVGPIAFVGGTGMVLVALGYAFYAGAQRLGWRYFWLGALAWAVAVVFKFVFAILLNPLLYRALVTPGQPGIGDVVMYLYIGALTGIFEVGLVWLFVRFSRLKGAGWRQALAFGVGFGAVEAFLLGLVSLGNMAVAATNPALVPPEAVAQLARANDIRLSLAPVSERFFTVWVHILSCALIFYAVAARKPSAFWLAFAYKTLVDSVAAYGQLTGLDTLGKIWAIEALVAVWGVLGWLGTRWVAARFPSGAAETPPAVAAGE
jgi:uncharacterized membrane protein YhfC